MATTALPLQDDRGHVRDLIFLRRLLAERGSTVAELRAYDAVIRRAQSRLHRAPARAA